MSPPQGEISQHSCRHCATAHAMFTVGSHFLSYNLPSVMCLYRKEWAELECGACEHVVLLTRSHVVGVAVPGRKRKKSLDVQYRDDVVLDFQEDQIFLEVRV